MFNDRYGLTQAVIEGRKTMTRRIMNPQPKDCTAAHKADWPNEPMKMYVDNLGRIYCEVCGYGVIKYPKLGLIDSLQTTYKLGEVVAIAQSYNSFYDDTYNPVLFPVGAGWNNKMFVKPELMPHQVRITGIKCERLQDISDADCMKEGVSGSYIGFFVPGIKCKDWEKESHVETEDGNVWKLFPTPRRAFASLIDKVSGRGMWDRNPWTVVYEFELLK